MKTLDDLHTKTADELQSIIQKLFIEISQRDQAIIEHKKTLTERNKVILEQNQAIESLRYQLNNALRHRFGTKSEKESSSCQLSLFDEIAIPENKVEIVENDDEITVGSYQRKKSGRRPLPQDLPRVRKIYDLSESEKSCLCGCSLTKIGEETTEQLEFIPAKVQVIQHVRYKYACKACEETIKTSKGPNHPIPKSIASPGLLAHVITSKFCDHLPLYRQENILQRMGVDIARNTLSYWMIKVSELFLPLYKLLQNTIITYDIAFSDETVLQVLKEPERPPEAKSYMWCFIGGPPTKRSVIYHYEPSRAHGVILQILDDFAGYLHCDGHSAYDTYARVKPGIILLGCWMHCRRKFYNVAKMIKEEGLAHKAIKMIAKLYLIEEELKKKSMTPSEIFQNRQQFSKPLLLKFKTWLDENYSYVRPGSPLGEAFSYALNQWDKLTRYIEDGRLEIDNGCSERAIKPFVIGRKNWLFCDSVAGARAAEVLYSIIETAKVHHVEPYSYLRYILTHLPNTTTEKELEALLPFNINHSLLTML